MTITSATVEVGADTPAFIERHLIELREMLTETGVLRLRGLGEAVETFDSITAAVVGSEPLEYRGGATPRTRLDRNIYSSTDFPPEYAIDLHSEMAYARSWPLYVAFCCTRPAATGGATPLASTTEVAERIPSKLAERLRRNGIRYRRAFSPVLGVDWRQAYGVDDLGALRYVAAAQGETVETEGDTVTTWWTLPAYLNADDGERWFNQLVAFNVRTLPAEVRDDLLLVVGDDGVPKNTALGDGTPFDDADIDSVRLAVSDSTTVMPWEAGDLTIIDNRRFAHGRQPFTGSRQVRVCMTGEGEWE